jgi:hypothetical protein
MCLKEIGLRAQNMVTILNSIININGGLYDYLKSTRISIPIRNKIFIWALVIGEFLGIISWDPNVCKSNRLQFNILHIPFIKLRYILQFPLKWSVIFMQSPTSTGYFSNSTGSFVTNWWLSPIIDELPKNGENGNNFSFDLLSILYWSHVAYPTRPRLVETSNHWRPIYLSCRAKFFSLK